MDDAEGQWEPFFYEQSDGKIRAFMRNFTKGIPHGTQWRLTTVGTGAAKGTPVSFPNDPVYSFMETVNCRPQIFRLDGGRYCLLQQDAFVNHRDYSTRLNVALHFSRSGADDFVAGPPLSRPGVISAYPQGVAHAGNIYLAYTSGPGDQPRGIEGAIVTPAPRADRYYVWPRSKELIKMQDEKDAAGKKKVVRTNPDARTALPQVKTTEQRKTIQFSARASAGVDIDPVDFAAGQSLEFRFETKVLRLQPVGRLVFCSLGDRIPIRLGMPANRPGKLYAYTPQPMGTRLRLPDAAVALAARHRARRGLLRRRGRPAAEDVPEPDREPDAAPLPRRRLRGGLHLQPLRLRVPRGPRLVAQLHQIGLQKKTNLTKTMKRTLTLLTALLLAPLAALHAADAAKPNVFFIVVDDLKPLLGRYGASWIKSSPSNSTTTRPTRSNAKTSPARPSTPPC